MTPELRDATDLAIKVVTLAVVTYGIYLSGKNGKAIKDVHNDVNGKMETLLKTTGKAEHAKGVKEEKERQIESNN